MHDHVRGNHSRTVPDRHPSEDAGDDDTNYINDELKYGASHQSVDSNPVESQSEWSDDECREEATGKFYICEDRFVFQLKEHLN